jgi:hypothetical protein
MSTTTPGGQPARHPRPHPLAKRPDETYEDWAGRVGPMPDHLVTLVREALLRGRVT